MNISQLQAFIAIATAGSLTAAAARLQVSQPGLSRQIRRLEEEVGAELLERGPTGVKLTPEGEKLLSFARQTVAAYEELLASSRDLGTPLSGRLRIVASTTPGEYLVPGLATGFSKIHPGVTTEVFVADSSVVAEEVLERRWDVGFVGRRTGQSRLEHVPVSRDEVVLAVPITHRFAGRDRISVRELDGERLIERERGSGTQGTVRESLEAKGLSMPPCQVAMVLGSTHAIVSAVDAGLGVGFVTAKALEAHDRSRVVAVRLSEVTFGRLLYMVYERGRPLSRMVRAFVDYVTTELPPPETE